MNRLSSSVCDANRQQASLQQRKRRIWRGPPAT